MYCGVVNVQPHFNFSNEIISNLEFKLGLPFFTQTLSVRQLVFVVVIVITCLCF